jgi:hypothetical protein
MYGLITVIHLPTNRTDTDDKNPNSSNRLERKKFHQANVARFNVGDRVKAADPYHRRGDDLGVVKKIEGDFYSVEWESDRKCYRYTIDELEAIG